MFAKAYEIASQFTLPVILSLRKYDKSVSCINGSFVILNKDGWIVTVAHIFEPRNNFDNDRKELETYKARINEIDTNPAFNEKQKRHEKNRLKTNPNWITEWSFWWGMDGVQIDNVLFDQFSDLAAGQLKPFDPNIIGNYPIIKNPRELKIGTSLCKLGFPFRNISATFNESANQFVFAPGTLPLPRFPLEGMYTRNQIVIDANDPTHQTKFIETSSPGLRGQSGGPIFDIDGVIWAIQSRTYHLELGFSPEIKRNGKTIIENQFINVGMGVHPEVLINFLSKNKIDFQLSES